MENMKNSIASTNSADSDTKPKFSLSSIRSDRFADYSHHDQAHQHGRDDHEHSRHYVSSDTDHHDYCSPAQPIDIDEADEETIHFNKIVDAFLFYRRHAELKLASKVKSIRSIPAAHLNMIPKFRDHIRHAHRCVIANYAFLKSVITATGQIFENRNHADHGDQNDQESISRPAATDFNMDKLHSTLRQIVRDWAEDGRIERDQCYKPILDQLIDFWPSEGERKNIRILVPGAGLGRLAFDIARLGFECQGNEFSLFMLFVSNFILNRCKFENEWTIFPYVHQWTNNWTYDDQIRSVQFPDVNPSDLPPDSNLSMTAGDFLDVYGGKKTKDTDPGGKKSIDGHFSDASGQKRKIGEEAMVCGQNSIDGEEAIMLGSQTKGDQEACGKPIDDRNSEENVRDQKSPGAKMISDQEACAKKSNKEDWENQEEQSGQQEAEQQGKWDCVVTVFFIDTAHNVIDYLQTIHKILRPGGYWLNLGPLLYHFSDMQNETSIELPYEEILEIAKKLGFEILSDERKLQISYTQNASSMLQYQYNCAYTIFRKVPAMEGS